MNTAKNILHTYPLTWVLVPAILVLAAALAVISITSPAAQGSHFRGLSSPEQIPTTQAGPIQPECQALNECGYIRMHTTAPSEAGGGPAGLVSKPVLMPECDRLPECSYIRMHIQADRGTQP